MDLAICFFGNNSLPIGYPAQILLAGARALDKIVRYIIFCYLGFEIQVNFAIFTNDFYHIKNMIDIIQDSQIIYEILDIKIPNFVEKNKSLATFPLLETTGRF